MLQNLNERGILAATVAYSCGSDRNQRITAVDVANCDYREVVLRTARDYAPGLIIAFDTDFGRTSSQ